MYQNWGGIKILAATGCIVPYPTYRPAGIFGGIAGNDPEEMFV
jgi:hypothetical protein